MSGTPRAGHIWTDPGAWFFHLQFYKKYVIIFKKAKLATKIFSHEHFIARRLFITREWKWDLLSKYFFDSHRQIFWKLRTKIFFWKLQAKLAMKILYVAKLRIFYHERGVHYKRTEMRLTLEGLFWKCGSLFFWEAKLASKILDFFRNDYFIERGLFITREWKLDLFLRYFFECGGQKIFLSRWVGIKISPLNIIT